jgi:hypothetical protein
VERVLIASFVLLLAGCAERPAEPGAGGTASFPPSAASTGRYQVSATVLESPDHGPQLCSAVAESLPPQCGGPDVVGWDWSAVDDEESANGTTWGEYSVVGTWDGERLTLTEPPGPPSDGQGPPPPGSDFSTPCPAPIGGWRVIQPATASAEGQQAAIEHANAQPDLGAVWFDAGAEPADDLPGLPEPAVLNVAFTGDLDRHERELRALYGGPLCVSQVARTQAELDEVQQAVHAALGADALGSGADGRRGVVDVQVTVVDPDIEARVAAVDPDGVVELHGWLQPVG